MRDIRQFREQLNAQVWEMNLAGMPRWRAWLTLALRVGYAVVRDLADGQLTLKAMSLVYTTLLSLAPLLAVSFSVLKAFGVHNQVEPLLLNFLEPMGEKGIEIAARIIEFVENIRVGVLGALGLALLFYTVLSLLQKIEQAFNDIWHVRQQRPFAQRFSEYLSVVLIGPVLIFSAVGIMASLMSTAVVQQISAIQPFGSVVEFISRMLPHLMIILAFMFVYIFVPNTRVRVGAALLGAVVAGVLWQITGWAFAAFIVTSAKYTAIYSAFATLILFLMWLYMSWLILMIGSSVAFYLQHPEYVFSRRSQLRLSNRVREKLALLIMSHIAQHYYQQRPPWTTEGLVGRLQVPKEAIAATLQALEHNGLLSRSADMPPAYLPAQPPETTPLEAVLDAVRSAHEGDSGLDALPPEPGVEEIMMQLDQAIGQALQGRCVKDLAFLKASEAQPAATIARIPGPLQHKGKTE